MVYDYVVTLKNRHAKHIDNVSILLCVISLLVFVNTLIHGELAIPVVVICILIVIVLAWNFVILSRKYRRPLYSKALLLAGVGWFAVPGLWWLAFPLLILAFIEKPAKADLEIGFSTKRIVMNSLVRRAFEWEELNNVMLKDDLLTMDFKNNKIIQRQTIEDDPDASEDEFNKWCAEQLSLRFSYKAG